MRPAILRALLPAFLLGCASPVTPSPRPPSPPLEPGCHLVEGSDGSELPSHLILMAEPSPEAAERHRVRLRLGGARVDDAGWWHRTEDGALVLLDARKSGGLDRLTIDATGEHLRASFLAGGRLRSVRLLAGCD